MPKKAVEPTGQGDGDDGGSGERRGVEDSVFPEEPIASREMQEKGRERWMGRVEGWKRKWGLRWVEEVTVRWLVGRLARSRAACELTDW